ncbi:MAG: hypothetical protein ACFE0I_08205 [Elainellaceae cyanobacterium]
MATIEAPYAHATRLEQTADTPIPHLSAQSASMRVAQASGSNCRVPNRLLDVYSLPSVASDSRSLATLQPNTRMSLDRNPDGSFLEENGFVRGFIASRNLRGYVIARHLTRIPGCGDETTPPPQSQTCARVTVAALTARENPAETARPTGQLVSSGEVVRILDDELERATGRTWVQVPVDSTTGWVAETGRFGNGRNLSPRFPCPEAVSTAAPSNPSTAPVDESELPLSVRTAVLQDAARRTNQDSALRIVDAAEETWPDGCLGLGGPNDVCTAALVPGWEVEVTDGEQTWMYRTDRQDEIRLESAE